MVTTCVAFGCNEKHSKNSNCSFFRFPKNTEIRNKWIRALKRKNWAPGSSARICSKHFQTGKPNKDPEHPDHVPNVFVYTKEKSTAENYEKRHSARVSRNSHKQNATSHQVMAEIEGNIPPVSIEMETSSTEELPGTEENGLQVTDTLSTSGNSCMSMEISFNAESEEIESLKNDGLLTSSEVSVEELKAAITEMQGKMSSLQSERDSFKLQCEQLSCEVVALRAERDHYKDQVKSFSDDVLANDNKLTFYSSLAPNIFKYILDVATADVEGQIKKLPIDAQLLLVLMKLKHNFKFVDLAYRFNVSRRTATKTFNIWLPILVDKLKCLIHWPTKKAVSQNLPDCFKQSIFKNTRVVIDCTEVFIQKAGNQNARSQTWSNYKHHHTLKFLVGISPSGHICFISDSFGGRSSDKEITLKSGFLSKIEPGDIVMADRGFNMSEYFALRGAKLITPTFLKTKRQLTLPEVMHSKNVSNVRIHVERVIKMIKRYDIISSVLPITLINAATDIVIVCAALSNLSKPIVR